MLMPRLFPCRYRTLDTALFRSEMVEFIGGKQLLAREPVKEQQCHKQQ